MEPDDPELAGLAADLDRAHGAGRWRVWRNNGLTYGWLQRPHKQQGTSPPVVLRDGTDAGLRARAAEFERVYAGPAPPEKDPRPPLMQALAAAEGLKT